MASIRNFYIFLYQYSLLSFKSSYPWAPYFFTN